MQIISQFAPLPLAQPAKGTAVAMGYFDGIHIGHRAVIEGAVQWAKTHDAAPAVFTFRLPVENKMKGKRLLSTEDKHALIHSLGVEYYLTPDFEAIKALSPEEFVRGIVEELTLCGERFLKAVEHSVKILSKESNIVCGPVFQNNPPAQVPRVNLLCCL